MSNPNGASSVGPKTLARALFVLAIFVIAAIAGSYFYFPRSRNVTSRVSLVTSAQQLINGVWKSVGPSPVQGCGPDAPPQNYCSGRVSAIALDPTNLDTVYIGGALGGVWKVTVGAGGPAGEWTPLTDDQPSLAIGSLAVDPSGVVYAGTGDGTERCDNYYGAGVLRSADGGKTWTQLGASTFGRATIPKIIVNPSSPNIVIASTSVGSTSSATACGIQVDPGVPLGIYVSTDSGTHWTRTFTATVKAEDMVLAPNSLSTVFAAVDARLYMSTDSGQTWSGPLGGGLPTPPNFLGTRIKLAASSNSTFPLVLYASIYDTRANQGTLYLSTNDGSTWAQVSTPTNFCYGCYGRMALAVDPTNPSTIYLGGIGLYRTTNGGKSWTRFLSGYWSDFHEDVQALAFNLTDSHGLYAATDGGIWYSPLADFCDASIVGRCWINYDGGLGLTQLYSIAAHPTDASWYFAGSQDNGCSQSVGGSQVWQMKGSLYNGESTTLYGDIGWTGFDPHTSSTMYMAAPYGGMLRSDDAGKTWAQFPAVTTIETSENQVPVAMDPTTPTTLYLGTYRLYKTTNEGTNWFLPSPGLSVLSTALSAIAVAPSNSQYVYAGTGSGTLFLSTDAGLHFNEIDTGLPLGRYLTKIAVDPSNPQKAYVTFSGFGGMHVYVTINAGTSWSDITSNLPDFPVDTIRLDSTGSVIFLGTDFGVFASIDSGATWLTVGTGLPNVPVYDLAFAADGTLLAATYGRSAWRLSP